ncbi:MAG: hypothetical protein II670_08310, partial [Alphaproteobacteria bacterium]|nr:hypothetical protein [Alphaproteobacteria bacterium]
LNNPQHLNHTSLIFIHNPKIFFSPLYVLSLGLLYLSIVNPWGMFALLLYFGSVILIHNNLLG